MTKNMNKEIACAFKITDELGQESYTSARVDKEHYELLKKENIPVVGKFYRTCNPLYEVTDKSNPVIYGSVSELVREAFNYANYTATDFVQFRNVVQRVTDKIAKAGQVHFRSKQDSTLPTEQFNLFFAGRKFMFFDTIPVEEIESNERLREEALAKKKIDTYEDILAKLLPVAQQLSKTIIDINSQLLELKK